MLKNGALRAGWPPDEERTPPKMTDKGRGKFRLKKAKVSEGARCADAY